MTANVVGRRRRATTVSSAVLCALLLAAPPGVLAQYNDRGIPIGERAIGLGGAYPELKGAEERTRTSTSFTSLDPQPTLQIKKSTNSRGQVGQEHPKTPLRGRISHQW